MHESPLTSYVTRRIPSWNTSSKFFRSSGRQYCPLTGCLAEDGKFNLSYVVSLPTNPKLRQKSYAIAGDHLVLSRLEQGMVSRTSLSGAFWPLSLWYPRNLARFDMKDQRLFLRSVWELKTNQHHSLGCWRHVTGLVKSMERNQLHQPP